MTMCVLVTGAAGFIGFHAARFLKKRGHRVVGLDNFNSYYNPELKHTRQARLTQEGVEVIEGDITNQPLLSLLYEQYKFTHLLHLAAQAGVRWAEVNPQDYITSNIQGFFCLLELCRKYPATPLVFASSSSVYGLNTITPFAENHLTDQPASFYAATKKAGEVMAFSYHHNYGIPMRALRFFTVYGPWGRPDMAYWAFSDAIRHNRPICLYNKGHMSRDFTYIDDILPAIEQALLLNSSQFEIFNLGNNRPEKIETLIALLEKGLNKKAIIEWGAAKKSEVPLTFADIASAQKKLHYAPTTSLERGIDHFLAWYTEVSTNLSGSLGENR